MNIAGKRIKWIACTHLTLLLSDDCVSESDPESDMFVRSITSAMLSVAVGMDQFTRLPWRREG